MPLDIRFDNSYAALPPPFYARLAPSPVAAPRLLALNAPLARELGLDPAALASPDGVAMLAGNALPEGAEPIALAYAGHQFGNFVPSLGDGRAILLGEILAPDGRRFDLQLKGSGRTPFSRSGDGRAALGPVLREFLVAEAMAALGIPSTRALAAVATGEEVLRETPLPGAVLARVATSHLRVGTFQYFAARGDAPSLARLVAYALARHFPDSAAAPNPALALLEAAVARQASLIARWMGVGFIHGVMNTDNCAISGETIDYGPCAFLDDYDPAKVFSSIDHFGRYAFANQPGIALWNLTRLAEALLGQIDAREEAAIAKAKDVLSGFAPRFEAAWRATLAAKAGLPDTAENATLAGALLELMEAQKADFTLAFHSLAEAATGTPAPLLALFADPTPLTPWLDTWLAHAPDAEALRRTNPAIIPRNHQVEAALAEAQNGNLAPFEALHTALATPFTDTPAYAAPPRPEQRVCQTFCGT